MARYRVRVTDDPLVSRRETPRISWARNGEDVVLMRALAGIRDGRFIEFREDDDAAAPAMKAFLDRGWTGSVGRLSDLSDATAADAGRASDGRLHVAFVAADLTVDDLPAVLDLARQDPWVLVLGVPPHDREAFTAALGEAGYRSCLYDGVSAYYVCADRHDELREQLSYPACARDHYLPRSATLLLDAARSREDQALKTALRWRERAVQTWADSSTGGFGDRDELLRLRGHAHELARGLEATQRTVSWRMTAPLRVVRRLFPVQDTK